MGRKCELTGKSRLSGHRVSHANNKTKHVFLANLQWKRIYVPGLKKFVRMRLSSSAIRTIDKLGYEEAARKGLIKQATS